MTWVCEVCGKDGNLYSKIVEEDGTFVRKWVCPDHLDVAGQSSEDISDKIAAMFGEQFREASFENFLADEKSLREVFGAYQEAAKRLSRPKISGEDIDAWIENLKQAKNSVLAFCESVLKERSGRILLQGKEGTGKTHLSAAMARVFIKEGMSVSHGNAARLITAIRSTYGLRGRELQDTADGILENLLSGRVLVVDDLTMINFTDDVRSHFYSIVNEAYQRRKIFVISSNYTIDELRSTKRLGPEVVDRIIEPPSTIVKITTPSFRLIRKYEEGLS